MPHTRPHPPDTHGLPACVRPAASPDVHMHTYSDAIACPPTCALTSPPLPMRAQPALVLPARPPSCSPPLLTHPAPSPSHALRPRPALAHTPSCSQQRHGGNDTVTIRPPRRRSCPALSLAITPSSPVHSRAHNSNVVTTTT